MGSWRSSGLGSQVLGGLRWVAVRLHRASDAIQSACSAGKTYPPARTGKRCGPLSLVVLDRFNAGEADNNTDLSVNTPSETTTNEATQ